MKKLLTAAGMKSMDSYTIETIGIPSPVLMERAALAVAGRVTARNPSGRIISVCGTGNNGGDGVAVARILRQKGFDAVYCVVGGTGPGRAASGDAVTLPEKMSLETRRQIGIADRLGVPRISAEEIREADVLIDALFGIGLSRPVDGEMGDLIRRLNKIAAWKIAVDIPSGVMADTGSVPGAGFRADETVTFAYGKPGLYLEPGRSMAGRVTVADIGIAPVGEENIAAFRLEKNDLLPLLARDPAGHKGSFGKVLAVSGSEGMCGAAYLCADAAFHAGCGMVRIQTPGANRIALQTLCPEAMTACGENEADFPACLSWADVLVIGPGLGQDAGSRKRLEWFLKGAWEQHKPVVLDADGLNLLAMDPDRCRHWLDEGVILTPHIGEMSRLTGKKPDEIKQDPLRCVREAAKAFGTVCVLKDAVTVAADPAGRVLVNSTGNAGMGTAGSGDVLAGVLGGLIAQHCHGNKDSSVRGLAFSPLLLAGAGVYLHGSAGDLAADVLGQHAMKASDISRHIGSAILAVSRKETDARL